MLLKKKTDINKLEVALNNSWQSDTCYPKDAARWSSHKPSTGQCAVSALVAQDYLGGKIVYDRRLNHYWLRTGKQDYIDFTRGQFEHSMDISVDGIANRKSLLNGERSLTARTRNRYEILKRRVAAELPLLKQHLVLLSSNSNEEYILDLLECFALPVDFVRHFRYQLIWLSKELRSILPYENGRLPDPLKHAVVIIAYLNQRKEGDGKYSWRHIVPIRTGRLIKAFRSGSADDDQAIAHFYFRLGSYISKAYSCEDEIRKRLGAGYQKEYAFLLWSDPAHLYHTHRNPVPLERLASSLEEAGFDYKGSKHKIHYINPLFVFFDGLFRRGFRRDKLRIFRGSKLNPPEYNGVARKSYYKMKEARSYFLKFRTYINKRELAGSYTIRLRSPKECFATPSLYAQNIKSQYDSETWELTPAFLSQNSNNYIEFIANHLVEDEAKRKRHRDTLEKPLNLSINLPIKICRSASLRFVEVLSDVAFAFGTLYLAISKLYENKPLSLYMPEWYIPVGISFLVGFVARAYAKWKRG